VTSGGMRPIPPPDASFEYVYDDEDFRADRVARVRALAVLSSLAVAAGLLGSHFFAA
jgi:hypothetical protein